MSENQTKKISVKQRKAIESLLTTATINEAAAAAGVGRDSIYRWMKDDTFISELRTAEAEAVQGLSRALVGLGEKATKALRDALDSDKVTVRLRAAEIVIGNLLKLRELVNIEERLSFLERQGEIQD